MLPHRISVGLEPILMRVADGARAAGVVAARVCGGVPVNVCAAAVAGGADVVKGIVDREVVVAE